jgi:large subunit ribosomal protein L9
MKVILNQDVTGLGEEGDIKDVANGYARNFLLPKNLAVPHTKEFLASLGHKKAAIEKRKEGKRLEAASLKERLEAEEIRFSVPAGENGKLFGSISNTNVGVELEKRGFQIEKKRIEIPEHTIRNVGAFKIRIRLYDKEEAILKLFVEGAAQPGSSGPAKPRQSRAKPVKEAVVAAAPEPKMKEKKEAQPSPEEKPPASAGAQ